MDFGKALEAMKADKKVRLPELPQGWYIVIGDVAWDNMIMYKTFMLVKGNEKNYESLKLIPRILLSNEWEILEDVQEVKLQCRYYVICPLCEKEYRVSSRAEDFVCGRCNKIFKIDKTNILKTSDNEILDKYKEHIKKMISGFDDEIKEYTISGQYQRAGISAWYKEAHELCLKSLNQIEDEVSKQQHEDTN